MKSRVKNPAKIFLLAFLILISKDFWAQESAQAKDTRQLYFALRNAGDTTSKIEKLNALALELSKTDPDTAILLSTQALGSADRMGFKPGIAKACQQLGNFYNLRSDYSISLGYYYRALRLLEQLEKENGGQDVLKDKCIVFTGLGIVYDNRSDFPKAMRYDLLALSLAEKLHDLKGQSSNLTNMGILLYRQGEFKKALGYLFESLECAKKEKDNEAEAVVLGDIACVYKDMKERDRAVNYFNEALAKTKDPRTISSNLANLGGTYYEEGDFKKALEYYFRALEIDKDAGDKTQLALDLGNIGWVYTDMKRNKEAEHYLLDAIKLDRQIGNKYYECAYQERISELYENMGQYDLAIQHNKEKRLLMDSIFSSEKNQELAAREGTYLFEKKEAEAKNKYAQELAVAEAEKKKQEIIIWSVFGGLVLVASFSYLLYRRFRIVREQKQLIAQQKAIVEEKQKEIVDSIRYAKRIQQSLLPKEKIIEKNLSRLKNV